MGQMDEIEYQLGNLRLTEEEEAVIELPQGNKDELQRKGGRSLIGKVCSDSVVGKEVIANTMEKI